MRDSLCPRGVDADLLQRLVVHAGQGSIVRRGAASAETGSVTADVAVVSRLPGAGGSAMPCGFVLPAAREKMTGRGLAARRATATAAYWYTLSVVLSTIQISCVAFDGSMVIPVGLPPPLLIVQLPRARRTWST